jgi:uncharacterized protein YkwD
MTRKTGAAILVLLLSLAGSLGAETAVGSVASSSSTATHAGVQPSADASSRPLPARNQRNFDVRGVRVETSCRGANILPSSSNMALMDKATTCLINRERVRAGIRALLTNPDLQQIASAQASEMVIGDYFEDDSMSGLTPMQRIAASGYAWRGHSLWIGQNIGWGTGTLSTPQAMVEGWMQSPPHRRIILTARYRNIGAGVAPSAPPALANGMSGATYSVELAARH